MGLFRKQNNHKKKAEEKEYTDIIDEVITVKAKIWKRCFKKLN